jgi:AraC-type DNA-binding domain-containing proteins
MKISEIFTKKSFLGRTYLWIATSIVATVIIFSLITYFSAERILMNKEYETSKKILYQVKYNIDLVNSTIINVCKSLFVNPDIAVLRYSDKNDNDEIDLILKSNRLTSSIEMTNPFLQSVTVYNGYSEQYYNLSTNMSLYFKDEELKAILSCFPDVPLLKPIMRKIKTEYGEKNGYENVFTYILYEIKRNSNKMEDAVVVNVKSSWLMDNIKMINMIERNKNDSIFLLNGNGEFINHDVADNGDLKKSLKEVYLNYKKTSRDSNGFFTSSLNGVPYVITYLCIDDIGWTLLKIQPQDEVFKYLHALKRSVLCVTVVFLIIVIIISLAISKNIYKPLGNLVNSISSTSQKKSNEDKKDEITWLNNVYKSMNNKLERYDQEKYKYKDIMKSYWQKKLLLESDTINRNVFDEIVKEYHITIPFEEHFLVCVLKIDDLENFKLNNNLQDRALIRFSAINISSELVSEGYPVEGIDMGEDHIALIISTGDGTGNYLEKLEGLLTKAQEYIKLYFNVSFTVSIGEQVNGMTSIHESYRSAMKFSMYRFIFGKTSVITPHKVESNIRNRKISYPQKLEEQLLQQIKSANEKGMEEALAEIAGIISGFNYDDMISALISLVGAIWKGLNELVKDSAKFSSFNFSSINSAIFELETMDEFFELLTVTLKDTLFVITDEDSNSENKIIVDTVVNIINKNYTDSGLCFNQIASIMKIYQRRLAKIFKEAKGISIPEYINNFRLEKASEMLKKNELSISEILEKVGIENETYFYNIFKKKYGTTPREYAVKMYLGIINRKEP